MSSCPKASLLAATIHPGCLASALVALEEALEIIVGVSVSGPVDDSVEAAAEHTEMMELAIAQGAELLRGLVLLLLRRVPSPRRRCSPS